MTRIRTALALMALTLVIAGCTGESGPVEVRGTDYAFSGLPATVEAGTEIRFTNGSESEAHEFVAVRLPDDETRSVGELLQLPPEEFGPLMMEGVKTVIVAAPGEEGVAVVGDGTLTEPGRYAIVCIIPTGADPVEYMEKAATSEGPPDVAGGPPHIVNGMFAEVIVEG